MVNSIVSFQEWLPWYKKIAGKFGYSPVKDQLAADILSDLISREAFDLQALKSLVSNKPVLIFGAGPSLGENLHQVMKIGLLEKFLTISADGATTALLKIANMAPTVVVSDLDGVLKDLLRANQLGSIMAIHGHGDNINQLRRYVPRFKRVIGTTQIEPRPNVYNFGGFTDGDRAVFLAASMKAKAIVLAGMDLGQVIGKYSKKRIKSIHTKILKLGVCKELLEWLAPKVNIPLYNLTGKGEDIKGFINITPSNLMRVIN